jgi:alpha-L-fucosidase
MVSDAIYGRDKYVGGPALTLKVTGSTRSISRALVAAIRNPHHSLRDLLRWQDAPAGRPFVTFSTNNTALPLP